MGANIEFTDNSSEFIRQLKDASYRALEACGLQAEGYAKLELERVKRHGSPRIANGKEVWDYPNVDTGRLVNSISHTTDEDTAYIGTNVEYAPYVEMGTSRSRPYPYLQPAVQNHKDEYKAIFESRLKDA